MGLMYSLVVQIVAFGEVELHKDNCGGRLVAVGLGGSSGKGG